MEKLTVIKIGGKVIDDHQTLQYFLKDFAAIEGLKILVHGGGKIASDFGQHLGIEPKMVEGRRITDKETLELVTMVYAGLVNKKIVVALQANSENAIGLTGADANILSASLRPVRSIDYGFAGDISLENVNSEQLSKLLSSGLTPVLCALTHDNKGQLLNTNADTIASTIAAAMVSHYKVNLVYCFEQNGVLSDLENQVVVDHIDVSLYQELKQQGIINAGMIPKMDNAFEALKAGVETVKIGHFSEVELLTQDKSAGTNIVLK